MGPLQLDKTLNALGCAAAVVASSTTTNFKTLVNKLMILGLWPTIMVLLGSLGTQPAQAQFTVLYTFKGTPDGKYPTAGMVLDAEGNLYGTTFGGGKNSEGTVFKLNPTTLEETVLHSFSSRDNDGENPDHGSLIVDNDGNLYGTTEYGGPQDSDCPGNNCGTVFQISTSGREKIVFSFPDPSNGEDGYQPIVGLVSDSQGNLYGTTPYGSNYNRGTVFELKKSGTRWEFSTLYKFAGEDDGGIPMGGLVYAGNSLYGTTTQGGDMNACQGIGCGTVFKLNPKTRKEIVLYKFKGGQNDGASPEGNLLFLGGKFYGTTNSGGSSGCGTVFVVAGVDQEKMLHSFQSNGNNKDGCGPVSGLVADANGSDMYGTTPTGGAAGCMEVGCGTVFVVNTNGSEGIIYAFKGKSDGSSPNGSLVFENTAGGILYGTAVNGGDTSKCALNNGCGTAFKVLP